MTRFKRTRIVAVLLALVAGTFLLFTPGRSAGQPDVRNLSGTVTSNYPAQVGRSSGGVVGASTRAGTNSFDGDVFELVNPRNPNHYINTNCFATPLRQTRRSGVRTAILSRHRCNRETPELRQWPHAFPGVSTCGGTSEGTR